MITNRHTTDGPADNNQTGLDLFGLCVCDGRGMLLSLLFSTNSIACVCLFPSEKGATDERGRRHLPSGLKKTKALLKQVAGNGALGACQDIV